MSNMSYCRFQNTSKDLDDCVDAVEELLAGEGKLGREELEAAITLANKANDLVNMLREYANVEDGEELKGKDIEGALLSANANAEERE